MMQMPTFKEWLNEFKEVDRPIGDLAKDILNDLDFPDTDNKNKILSYLELKNVDPIVIGTFKDVWEAYKMLI